MRFLPNLKFLTLAGAAGLALGLANQPTAEAATVSTNLTVNASVAAACSVTTSALDIGLYDSLNINATANKTETTPGNVNVTCANGLGFTVDLGNGQNFAGGTRQMQNTTVAGEFLAYSLFDGPSAGGTPWPAGGLSGTGAGPGSPSTFVVGGMAPAGQAPQGGLYQDQVLATVSF